MSEGTTETTFLPCGCSITTGLVEGRPAVVMHACRDGCPTVRLLLESADEANKPVHMRSSETITVTCLGCGKVMDAATPIDGNAALPEPGALSICMYCAFIAIYDRNPDGDLYLRWPTLTERAPLDQDTRIAATVEAIRRQARP